MKYGGLGGSPFVTMRIPMIAATDCPQTLIIFFRHRRLAPLKGAVRHLPISQSRYRTADAIIKAGIRIESRSDFITAHFIVNNG
jgi:hypothetical protein